MEDILKIAVGVFLAFATLRGLDYLLALPERRRHERFHSDMKEIVSPFIDEMHAEMVKEREAAEKKAARRRKPATQGKGKIKGAATTKPVAKKGATNVKAKTRR